MRLCVIRSLVALAGLAAAVDSSWGQSPSPSALPSHLSLSAALEEALAESPEILAVSHQIEAARARVLVAEGFDPAEVSLELEEVPGGNLGRAGATTLGIAQDFRFPGKRGLAIDLARQDVRILQAEERQTRRRVETNVTEAYFLAKFLEKRTSNLQESVGLLSDFLQTTQNRFEGGAVPYLDVVRAKIELGRLRNDLLESGRESQAAKTRLNLLLGRPGSAPIELVTELALERADPDKQTSVDHAVEASANLEIERLRLQSTKLARDLAGRSFLPDVGFQLSVRRLREDGGTADRWGAGVGLRVPLWWWKAPRGAAREADAEVRRQETSLAAREREVRAAAEQAWDVVSTSRSQLSLFQTSLRDDLDSELRSGIDAYRTGRVDALSLLDIYRTNVDSRTEYDRSLYLHLSALARLEAAGDLEP